MEVETRVPRNREQAYGYSVATAINQVERSYQVASLKRNATLPGNEAQLLDTACTLLKELFPNLPSVDAYASSDKLIPMLNYLYRAIAQNEDSVMRQHFQAFVKARLYSKRVTTRVRDLVSDQALISISNVDSLPLSLVLGENRFFLGQSGGGGVKLLGYGIESGLPSDLMESGGRPFIEQEKVSVDRHGIMKKIAALLDAFGPLVTLSPWSRIVDRGALRPMFDATIGEEFPSDMLSTPTGIQQWIAALSPANVALVNGNRFVSYSSAAEEDWLVVASRVRGNTVAVVPTVGVAIYTEEAGNEAHGTLMVLDSVSPLGALVVTVTIDGNVAVVVPMVLTGTASATTAVGGGVTFTWAEYTTQVAGQTGVTWTLRNLTRGQALVTIARPAVVPAPGVMNGLILSCNTPQNNTILTTLSDSELLEQIKSRRIEHLMGEYFLVRSQLSDTSVPEGWWLQAYAEYIVGSNSTFSAGIILTLEQITAVKTRMMCPETWPYFRDLKGFLNKLFDDLGGLMALAQSSSVY